LQGISINKNISVLYRYALMYLAKRLKPYGLCGGEHPFILYIKNNPGVCQEKLSRELGIDKGTTAKMTRKLEEGGWIERKADKNDKRFNRLFTTQKSEKVYDGLMKEIDGWYGIILSGLSPQEIALLNNLLEKAAGNAKESGF